MSNDMKVTQPQREAVLEEAARFVEQWNGDTRDGDTFLIAEELRALKTTPAPAEKPHCATCGKNVTEVLCKTCGKWWAENLATPAPAETVSGDTVSTTCENTHCGDSSRCFECDGCRAFSAAMDAPAVSTDEIVAVFSENLPYQAIRLGVHYNGTESPGQWRDRVRKAAILSRLRGEK